jgi:hypothetical protein
MAGIILASSISGSLDAKNIVMDVITQALDIANLPVLGPTVPVDELTGTVVSQVPVTGNEDLSEWETAPIQTGVFAGVNFDLKKDRVKIAVSDEARMKSRKGDPLILQKSTAADEFARILDKKIVTALQTSPQTGAASAVWSTVTNNPLKDIATAVGALRPYTADYIIMPTAVWSAFAGNNYTAQFVQGNAVSDLGKALTRIPGLNLDVFVNDNVTAKSCIIGCKRTPSFVIGQGPIKVRQYDDPDGGEVIQIDNFRQVKDAILKNSSNLNRGAYALTSVIA